MKSVITPNEFAAVALLLMAPLLTSCNQTQDDAPPPAAPTSAQPRVEAVPSADWMTERLGGKLVKGDGSEVDSESLKGKTVGLYFSAHWCPPCKVFSPKLVEAYNRMTEDGKPIEIVLISSDRNEKAMYNYMKELQMPWLALPYTSKKRQQLAQQYEVRGIPTLVILNPDGETITRDGRNAVMKHGADAYEQWASS